MVMLIVIRQPARMSACSAIRGGMISVGIAGIWRSVMRHLQSYILTRLIDTHQQFGYHTFYLSAIGQARSVGVPYQYTPLAVVSLITRMDADSTSPGYMIYQWQQSPELGAVGYMHGVNQFWNQIG